METSNYILPDFIQQLLKTAKFVHLATCNPRTNEPNVSLMNYVLLTSQDLFNGGGAGKEDNAEGSEIANAADVSSDSSSDDEADENSYILLATHTNTTKYENIIANSNVSVLVHDWTTLKNLVDTAGASGRLAQLLRDWNQTEMGQFSVTLKGQVCATVSSAPQSPRQEKEFRYYRDQLLRGNREAEVFVEGSDIALLLIRIVRSKVSDTANNVIEY